MKPNKKVLSFIIDILNKEVDEYERIIYDFPKDMDAINGTWKSLKNDIKDTIEWIKEENAS